MEESISRESGADYGENLPAEEIAPADPRDRPHAGRAHHAATGSLRRFDDPALDPPSLEPGRRGTTAGPRRWRTAPAESVVALPVRDSAPAA